ncbi:MAG TPA: hypothetical protein VHG70_13070 [Nocardioidaceae bacterium]|nr:hypothetical protein [Nocardioidaceae bacterium]
MPPPRQASTSIQLNPIETPEAQRTYVILGTRRGGTSMIAGVARALGLDLGELGNRKNNEDPRFQNRPVEKMRDSISQRNDEADVWGWKFPAAGNYLPDVWASLRNPYFLIVYRDPIASALSQSRFDRPRARRTERLSIHESSANSNLNTGFALAVDRPCLLVSHERATHDPNALIDDIAEFLEVSDVSADLRERILEYVKPGHYKVFDDFFGAGQQSPAQQDAGQQEQREATARGDGPGERKKVLGQLRERFRP